MKDSKAEGRKPPKNRGQVSCSSQLLFTTEMLSTVSKYKATKSQEEGLVPGT